jgi:hypothetical protein
VILHVNFEELQALDMGAQLVRSAGSADSYSAIAAPSAAVAETEAFRAQLTGDISIETLAEQRQLRNTVSAICQHLRERLESKVIEFNPGHEEAVDLYFDYAHTVTVLDRLDRLGAEMSAMIEVMTGTALVSTEAAASITFPD